MSFIAGLLTVNEVQPLILKRLLDMRDGRGNDDSSLWFQGHTGLGARQLRTLDLTPDGNQPITSKNGVMTVILDGFIANGAALKRELEDADITLRGHSDAELLAEGAAHWGLNRLLQKMEGAFAFALWDADTTALHLVRDRFGARPLYVTESNGFAFASDLRAFKALDGFTAIIDPDAAACYLSKGYVSPPLSLWHGVMALQPGHRLMIKQDDTKLGTPEAWWSPATTLEEIAMRGREPRNADRTAVTLAAETVRLDVPFAVIDDFSAASSMLRTALDRATDKSFKTSTLQTPDGAILQKAFDALAQLPEPVSDPGMVAIWTIFNRSLEAPIVLIPTALTAPSASPDDHSTWRAILTRLPRFLVPKKYLQLAQNAGDLHAERNKQWPIHCKVADTHLPRTESGIEWQAAFLDFTGNFIKGYMPAIDRIAASFDCEARLPMADARMLEHGFPSISTRANADIATWLRGPLRPRMQDLMNDALFTRLGIDDIKPYTKAWDEFLAGDNTMARPLWTLASLLAWAKAG